MELENISRFVLYLSFPKGILNLKEDVTFAYNLEWLSHSADWRKSIRRIDPFELLYTSILHWIGWNSAEVITSEIYEGNYLALQTQWSIEQIENGTQNNARKAIRTYKCESCQKTISSLKHGHNKNQKLDQQRLIILEKWCRVIWQIF